MNFDDYKAFDDKLKPGEGTFVHATVTVRVPVAIATRKDSIADAAALHYEIAGLTWAALDNNFSASTVKPEDIEIIHLELRHAAPVPTTPQLANEADTMTYMGLSRGDWDYLPADIRTKLSITTWKATS